MYMKKCTVCKLEKSIEEFREAKGYKGGRHSQCKGCEADRLREWRKSNPDKTQAQWSRNNAKRKMNGDGYYNPDRKQEWSRRRRNSHLKKKYNITLLEWESVFEAQGHKCLTCHRSEGLLEGGGHVRMVTDHCHKTNRLRGIICNDCNRALGAVRDEPETLQNLIDYLMAAQEHGYVGPIASAEAVMPLVCKDR
jgi:hypothetical protein